VIAMMLLLGASVHAVIQGVGIDEAMYGVAAVTEGQDGWWGHEAKGGEGGDCHCHPEAKPSAKSPHYETSLVGWGAPRKPRLLALSGHWTASRELSAKGSLLILAAEGLGVRNSVRILPKRCVEAPKLFSWLRATHPDQGELLWLKQT
jgi:hypothetical protein